MKKALSFVLAVMMLVSFAACGSNPAAETPGGSAPAGKDQPSETVAERDTIVYAYNKMLEDFSPFGVLPDQATANQIFEPLWKNRNPSVPLKYCIAESHEWIDDTHCKVILKDNVFDTAGNKITASDVLFSFSQSLNSSVIGLLDLENTTVEDDLTLILATKTPSHSSVESNLSFLLIASQKAFEESADGMALTPVGTGPYKLGDFVAGASCTLDCNEDYHGFADGLPAVKHVKVMFIVDAAQRMNVMLTQEADYAQGISNNDIATVDGTDYLESYIMTMANQLGIYFNMQSPVMKDNLALRQAICYALDNESIASLLNAGKAPAAKALGIAAGAGFTDAVANVGADTGYYAYNVEKAKELVAEANLPAGTVLRFAYGDTAGMDVIGDIIQGACEEIGLTVETTHYTGASYAQIFADPTLYEITPLSLASDPTASWFNYSLGFNLNFFEGEVLDRITAETVAANTLTGAAAEAALVTIEKDFYENAYAYGIYDCIMPNAINVAVNPAFDDVLYPSFADWTFN